MAELHVDDRQPLVREHPRRRVADHLDAGLVRARGGAGIPAPPRCASRCAPASPCALKKARSPHMVDIFPRGRVERGRPHALERRHARAARYRRDQRRGAGADHGRGRSREQADGRHRVARPGLTRRSSWQFMRTGWRDTELPVSPAARGAQLRQAPRRALRRVPRRDAGDPDRPREGAGQRHRLPVPAGQRLRLPDRRPRPGQRAGAAARTAPATTPCCTCGPARPGRPTSSSAAALRRAVGRPPAHARARSPTELGLDDRRPDRAGRGAGRPAPRAAPGCCAGSTRRRRGRAPVRRAAPTAAGPRPGAGHRASPS